MWKVLLITLLSVLILAPGPPPWAPNIETHKSNLPIQFELVDAVPRPNVEIQIPQQNTYSDNIVILVRTNLPMQSMKVEVVWTGTGTGNCNDTTILVKVDSGGHWMTGTSLSFAWWPSFPSTTVEVGEYQVGWNAWKFIPGEQVIVKVTVTYDNEEYIFESEMLTVENQWDSTPPTCQFFRPTEGGTITSTDQLSMQYTDLDTGVAEVDIHVDGAYVRTLCFSEVYIPSHYGVSVNAFNDLLPGVHTVQVRNMNAHGSISWSQIVTFNIVE